MRPIYTNLKKLLVVISLVLVAISGLQEVEAASLTLRALEKTQVLGELVRVDLLLDTEGETITKGRSDLV